MRNRRGKRPAARFAAFQVPKCSITVCGCTRASGSCANSRIVGDLPAPLGGRAKLARGSPRRSSDGACPRETRRALPRRCARAHACVSADAPSLCKELRAFYVICKFSRAALSPAPAGTLAGDGPPARARDVTGARARRPLAARGRGGGTTLPGKLLWKLDPGAVDALAARLPDGVALVSATNGKTTTTAMVAEILGTRSPPRVEPRRRESRLRGRLGAPRRARAPSSGCSRSTKARCPRCRRERGRASSRSATSSATSSTATASSSSSPSAGAPRSRRSPPETTLVVNADDPLVGDLADGRPGAVRFGLDDPRHGAPAAPARGRLEVLRSLRRAVRLRRRVRRSPRRLPLPGVRPRTAPRSTSPRATSSSAGSQASRSTS